MRLRAVATCDFFRLPRASIQRGVDAVSSFFSHASTSSGRAFLFMTSNPGLSGTRKVSRTGNVDSQRSGHGSVGSPERKRSFHIDGALRAWNSPNKRKPEQPLPWMGTGRCVTLHLGRYVLGTQTSDFSYSDPRDSTKLTLHLCRPHSTPPSSAKCSPACYREIVSHGGGNVNKWQWQ